TRPDKIRPRKRINARVSGSRLLPPPLPRLGGLPDARGDRMRVTIVASGTRGDVQPLIPLAHGLQAAGHEVAIAAADDSQPLVTRHGLVFRSLGSGTHDQLTTDAGRAWIADSAGRPFRELRHMRRVYEEAAQPMAEGLLRLAGTADVFVSGILTL